VYRGGLPVAFIDWDAAQPTDPQPAAARGASERREQAAAQPQ
jgi:hypothetical protein